MLFMNNVKLDVFIAGSKALERERNLFKIVAQDIQQDYHAQKKKDVRINVYTFESFGSICENTQPLQGKYNNFIKGVADIVFFVFDGNIGGITMEEYLVAEESYKKNQNKKPKICIFTKVTSQVNMEIENLKKRISEIDQYWVDYKNEDDLRFKINRELSREIDAIIYPKHAIIRHLFIAVFALICIVLGILFRDQSNTDEPLVELVKNYELKVVDELSNNGRLIINAAPSDILKYHISKTETNVNWAEIAEQIYSPDTLYFYENCFINIYGHPADDESLSCSKTFEFNFNNYVETAIRSKNTRVVTELFDNSPLTVNFPEGVCDVLVYNQVNELYSYLVEYGYHISAIETSSIVECYSSSIKIKAVSLNK